MFQYKQNIIDSGITIYDTDAIYNPDLFIPNDNLQSLLNEGLIGLNLSGLPLRTRSKFVKTVICKILGFPEPSNSPLTIRR